MFLTTIPQIRKAMSAIDQALFELEALRDHMRKEEPLLGAYLTRDLEGLSELDHRLSNLLELANAGRDLERQHRKPDFLKATSKYRFKRVGG